MFDEFDCEVENKIIAEFEGGNIWAWCVVKVTARYDGILLTILNNGSKHVRTIEREV